MFKSFEYHLLFISGAENTYKSKWFAYDEFGFMADKNDPGRTRDTLPQVSYFTQLIYIVNWLKYDELN